MTSSARQKSFHYGMWAEYLAIVYLWFKGYRILKYRYKCALGEIDILALKGKTLAAVEVKFRKQAESAAHVFETIHTKNQKRVEKALLHFLAHHPRYADHQMRFDALVMTWPFSIAHLDNAWEARS